MIQELWAIVKDAGPLALAACFFLVWHLERSRANDEREFNRKMAERLVAAFERMSESNDKISELLRDIRVRINGRVV